MDVEDVARAIVYVAGLPPGANVQFMTVMPSKMPLVGRGGRAARGWSGTETGF